MTTEEKSGQNRLPKESLLPENEGWEVRYQDIVWANTVIQLLKDGGTLGMPGCMLVYKINHRDRVLVKEDYSEDVPWMEQRTRMTFAELDYAVQES